VYCVQGDPDRAGGATLAAYDLKDGAPAWRRYLAGPSSGWVLALTERGVVAHPRPGRPGDEPLDALPLVVCRRDTGAPVQRLVFPATVSDLAVRLAPGAIQVATQAGLWGLGERPTVDGARSPR